jgi:DNA-binding PadR family transcriptional regulator
VINIGTDIFNEDRDVGRKKAHKPPPGHPAGQLDTKSPLFHGLVRGALPWYLLSLLRDGPLHGIQMIHAMEEMSGGTWKPSPGSVYPVLQRLDKDGLITGKLERTRAAPKRVYRLTAKGRSALPQMQEQLLGELRAAREIIDLHIQGLEQSPAGGGHGHK